MGIQYGFIANPEYLQERQYQKTCEVNMYWCQMTFYRNATHYLRQFVCQCGRRNR